MIPVTSLRTHPADTVATALVDLDAGAFISVDGASVRLVEAVARGHKVALAPIAKGEAVIKYGFPIGVATAPIAAGAHVHSHNLATALSGSGEYRYAPAGAAEARAVAPRSFRGYARADGRAGTRNEIWILPTVGCVGNLAARVARIAGARHAGRVDGIHAFKHPFGCSQLGDDLGHTRGLLAALAQHPNAGGVLIVGLGCESNQLDALIADIPPERRASIRTLSAQAVADDEAACLALVDELVEGAAAVRRSDMPLSALTLGVKCGGSDGLSGLTANPLVGRMADAVAGAGGKVILTEIPEIFGAEQLLMDRAASREVFDETVALVRDFKDYFLRHGEPVSENPSPGNIAGGITTLEEKSLGAVQKGGQVPLADVRRYGGEAARPGLTLLEAPGNDAVSSTALTAAGATIILFTTGRGTPLGFPAPTLKIASNSALAERKAGWIDFDAGRVLEDGFDAASDALLDLIVAAASGEETKAELNEERDIAIWKSGVTL
ncbi:UxaA family hydrolase [Sphingopyxis indica]|uniref:UxaA family hydrolase n=1 Tax=Sphingopyxis indica TaxID=436663 RepID=UPI0029390EA8|nr:altronate dehydratase family protein [Sphingopyxis indica]